MDRINFITYINGEPTMHETFESAARQWDMATYLIAAPPGGISMQQFDAAGNMTRDGWLVHVHEDGQVYINPNLVLGN